MQKNLSATNFSSIHHACSDIQRGLLKLTLALASHSKYAMSMGEAMATSQSFSVIELEDWKNALSLWTASGLPLLADLSSRACPACDSSESHTVFQSYDGYPFCECEQCGTWYVPLQVDWQLFERFFEICPEGRLISEKTLIKRQSTLQQGDFTRLERYFRSAIDLMSPRDTRIRYLDIGCSTGNSLTVANKLGFLAHGVEADTDAAAFARENDKVVVSHISALEEKYDLISMWETLEHIADPHYILREVASRLLPGGLLAVTVPNLNATGLRVSREKCSYAYGGFNSPGHINFFNHRTIDILFKRCGLALVEVTYEYSTNPYELFGYLSGIVSDERSFAMAGPPQTVAEILNQIWPAITLLENFGSTLPIMCCLACRSVDVTLFSAKAKERVDARRELLRSSAKEQLDSIPDPEKSLRELTAQYIKMHDHLQDEVNKRDAMLVDMQRLLNEK